MRVALAPGCSVPRLEAAQEGVEGSLLDVRERRGAQLAQRLDGLAGALRIVRQQRDGRLETTEGPRKRVLASLREQRAEILNGPRRTDAAQRSRGQRRERDGRGRRTATTADDASLVVLLAPALCAAILRLRKAIDLLKSTVNFRMRFKKGF